MIHQSELSQHFQTAARTLIYIFIFFIPLAFFPFTLEPLEINKQTFLLLFICASALAFLASMLAAKKILFFKGWMNLLPMFYIFAFLFPAFFSIAPYVSWIGAHRQEYTSVLTSVFLGILMFLVSHLWKDRKAHRHVHGIILLSTFFTTLVALLSLLGFFSFSFAKIAAFTPVGTLTSFSAFLIAMTSFFLAALISHRPGDSLLHQKMLGVIEQICIIFLTLVTFFFLLVLDDYRLWILFVLSLVCLCVFVFFRAGDFVHRRLILPVLLIFLSIPFWFWLPGVRFFQVPLEVTPNTKHSLDIAQMTFQKFDATHGSGPGTYFMDYTQFHDSAVNETDFWSTRFDRASSHALTLLPTLGFVGVAGLLLFIVLLFLGAIRRILYPASHQNWLESFVHLVPWVSLVLSAFFIPWNMTLTATFGIFSGLLLSQLVGKETHRSFEKSSGSALVCSVLFCLLGLVLFVGIFFTTQRYAAEIAFAKALRAEAGGKDTQEIVALLDRAASLNRYHDTYYRALAQALIVRVKEEMAHSALATPESAQYLQSLIASSVNASVQASTLSSYNVLNWLTRGSVYRELIPLMGNASAFAIESFVRATALEPKNPSVWVELGKTYSAAASQAFDPNEKQEFFSKAEEAFAHAVQLKSNYAPAHFQLALILEKQGRLEEAIEKMERVAQFNPLDVGVHFELGVLYLKRNAADDLAKAQEMFEKAIALAPAYSNAHWFLAAVYERQGKISQAVQEMEKVLELNPDNATVQARLKNLLNGQVSHEIPEAIE